MRRKSMQVSIETIIENAGLTEAFERAISMKSEFHLRIENGGWLPLVIEVTGEGFVAVTHYIDMGGDAVADPEIVFIPTNWLSVEITQGPLNRWKRVEHPGRQYYRGIESLARIWAKNLRHQGFTGKDVIYSSTTHDPVLQAAVKCHNLRPEQVK